MAEQKTAQMHGCLVLFLLFVALSLIDVRLITNVLFARYERMKAVAITTSVPDMFPVLVVSKSDTNEQLVPAIVFYENLPGYLKSHPSYSYIVPEDKIKQLNRALKKYKYDSGFGVGKFTVSSVDGKQSFKVEGTWDDDRVNIGWYDAEDKAFTPKRHVWYFGPSVAAVFMLHIVLWNIVASLLIYFGYRYYNKYRSKLYPSNEPESDDNG